MNKKIYMKVGFPEINDVSGRFTIADLYPDKSNRTGIYLLSFPEGDYYIGQTVDIVRRFSEHLKSKGAISGLAFYPCSANILDDEERRCVSSLQYKCKLRNIELVTYPQIETNLETLIGNKEQEEWLLTDFSVEKNNKFRICETLRTAQRVKYSKRFQKLYGISSFLKCGIPVMQKYMRYCICEPVTTEMAFWSCSCLPPYNRQILIFSRLNLRSSEVFTLGYDRMIKKPFYSFHISKSRLFANSKAYLQKLQEKYLTFYITDHAYSSAGDDQCNIHFYDFEEVMDALDNQVIHRAIKFFNLGQMRRGATMYRDSHCVDLADCILKRD